MKDSIVSREMIDLVRNYSAPAGVKKTVSKMKIALIVSIPAAGRDSIRKKLLDTGNYSNIITSTSRAMRAGETDGESYYFFDNETVRENLLGQKYFEAKIVHGRVYGTTIAELERISHTRKIALGDVDVQGVEEYNQILGDKLRAIFVIPPSFDAWQERLKKRDGDTLDPDEVRRRMLSAEAELDFALKAKYYRFVVNDNLERATKVSDDLIRKRKKYSYKDEFAHIIAEKLHNDILSHICNCPKQFNLRAKKTIM